MTLQLTPWQTPPLKPALTAGAVQLWRFPLDCPDSLEHLLDEEELQRARRLRALRKARAFVVARARLRQILAGYLDLAPQALRPGRSGPADRLVRAAPRRRIAPRRPLNPRAG